MNKLEEDLTRLKLNVFENFLAQQFFLSSFLWFVVLYNAVESTFGGRELSLTKNFFLRSRQRA